MKPNVLAALYIAVRRCWFFFCLFQPQNKLLPKDILYLSHKIIYNIFYIRRMNKFMAYAEIKSAKDALELLFECERKRILYL